MMMLVRSKLQTGSSVKKNFEKLQEQLEYRVSTHISKFGYAQRCIVCEKCQEQLEYRVIDTIDSYIGVWEMHGGASSSYHHIRLTSVTPKHTRYFRHPR